MKRVLIQKGMGKRAEQLLLFCLFAVLPSALAAQDFTMRRGGCIVSSATETDTNTAETRSPKPFRLPAINKHWDPNRIYKQLVVLVSFAGDNTNFRSENPREFYNNMLNTSGFNQRNGKGCMADYFREQSNGLFNVQFDVYGPYQVDYKANPYEKPTIETKNQNTGPLTAATKMLLTEHPEIDFSQYDWNNDNRVDQVIFICAGYQGNVNHEVCYGYMWPFTGTFASIATPDGKFISQFSVSCELWPNNSSAGISTICHEFCHCLGLPDIYPVPEWTYSAVDEWDLMDGGNFTNYGWCPPNFSPLERMLLGWLTPVELTGPTTISGMKSTDEGGTVYQIKHTDNEYLLLENRQWRGWDKGVPGKGLVIYHVNYIASKWSSNTVNGTENAPFNYSLICADNRSYDDWDVLCDLKGWSKYANKPWMNARHMSGAPYPYVTDSTEIVNELTDTSIPAARMINANENGSKMLMKPITNITMSDDGLISFDFMGGNTTEMIVETRKVARPAACYRMNGLRATASQGQGFYIIRQNDGTVKKVFK